MSVNSWPLACNAGFLLKSRKLWFLQAESHQSLVTAIQKLAECPFNLYANVYDLEIPRPHTNSVYQCVCLCVFGLTYLKTSHNSTVPEWRSVILSTCTESLPCSSNDAVVYIFLSSHFYPSPGGSYCPFYVCVHIWLWISCLLPLSSCALEL